MTVQDRVTQLEQNNKRLSRLLRAVVFMAAGAFVFLNIEAAQSSETAAHDVLQARMLEIVDENGVVRVRVGAKLPDAVIDGKSVGRGGEEVAGVMLYDGTGQERGGYVTFEPSGNIGLTLDSRKSQVALFAAGPDGGTALRLWDGPDAIELRVDDSGARLTTVADYEVVHQVPVVETIDEEGCSAYRDAIASYSLEYVMRACSSRFPTAQCEACLDRNEP